MHVYHILFFHANFSWSNDLLSGIKKELMAFNFCWSSGLPWTSQSLSLPASCPHQFLFHYFSFSFIILLMIRSYPVNSLNKLHVYCLFLLLFHEGNILSVLLISISSVPRMVPGTSCAVVNIFLRERINRSIKSSKF